MRKIFLLFLAYFAFGVDENELKFYEQILSELKTEQIPPFIERLAQQNLPYRVDEMTILSSLGYSGLNIDANFTLNDTKDRKISRYNSVQIKALKNEFYKNGKDALCHTAVSYAILNRGITLNGHYTLKGRRFFDITMDKNSCE